MLIVGNMLNLFAKKIDKETRDIVTLYVSAEIDSFYDAVWKPSEEQYPLFKPITQNYQKLKGKDYLKSLDDLKTKVRLFKGVLFFNNSEKVKQLRSLCDVLEETIPELEEFYINAAKSIKEISQEKRISFEEIVTNCRDQVKKRVFPSRNQAERYKQVQIRFMKNLFSLARMKPGETSKTDIPEITEDMLNNIEGRITEYLNKELEMIYR